MHATPFHCTQERRPSHDIHILRNWDTNNEEGTIVLEEYHL